MYKQIFTKLSQAKEIGQKEVAKKALLFFILEIEKILDLPTNVLKKTLPFSDFIKDSNYIFKADNISIFNKKNTNISISTDGLVVELFNVCNISDGKKRKKISEMQFLRYTQTCHEEYPKIN
jgi:hypothetical protein